MKAINAQIPPDRNSLNDANRLASENLFLAHERTQLAWVQVDLALISFGFTIAKVVQMIHENRGERGFHISAALVGILMISISLIALTIATLQHWRTMSELRKRCPGLPISQSSVLAVMQAGLGVVALFGAILRQ